MLDNKQFEDKAWEQMKGILDKEMPDKKGMAWWWFAAAGLGVILVLGFVYVQMGDSTIDQIGEVAEIQTAPLAIGFDNQLVDDVSKDTEYSLVEQSERITEIVKNDSKADNKTIESVFQKSVSQLSDSNGGSSEVSSTHSASAITNAPTINLGIPEIKNIEKPVELLPITLQKLPSDGTENSPQAKQIFSVSSTESNEVSELVYSDFASIGLVGKEINQFNDYQDRWIEIQGTSTLLEPTFIKPTSLRTTALFAYAEANYLTDFGGLGYKLGIISEVGATESPWSFSTGVTYELNTLRVSALSRNSPLSDSDNSFPKDIETVVGVGGAEEVEVTDARVVADLHYINVPLLFHYRFNKLKIGLGIDNSFLVHTNYTEALREFEANNVPVRNSQQVINKYQLSAIQSLQYRISPNWNIGLKFDIDLTGVFSPVDAGVENTLDNVGLSLAYRLK